MNFLEMMVNLQSGKKVRHKNWDNNEYMTFTKQGGIVKNFQDQLAALEHFVNHLYDDCWELFEDNLVTFDKVPIGERFQLKDKSGYAVKVKGFDNWNCVVQDIEADCFMSHFKSDEQVYYPVR